MKVLMEGPWKEEDAAGMIMTQKDKRGTMRQFFLQNDKGIFLHKLGLSKTLTPEINTRFNNLPPPMPAVIFPLTPGTKVHWEGRLKVTGIMNKPIIFDGEVTGWEDIEVPAGKFHCIKLHFHEKRGDDVIDEDAWYADGVGQVKYDGGQYIKELKSYRSDEIARRKARNTETSGASAESGETPIQAVFRLSGRLRSESYRSVSLRTSLYGFLLWKAQPNLYATPNPPRGGFHSMLL